MSPLGHGAGDAEKSALLRARPALAHIEFGEELGCGGYARVWAGVRRDGASVAVKVSHVAGDSARRRFCAEAEALAAVGAPHAPALHESDALADGRPYLVLDNVAAPLLSAWTQRRSARLPFAAVRAVSAALLVSVEAVHRAGLIHLDLKPSNIFVVGELAGHEDLVSNRDDRADAGPDAGPDDDRDSRGDPVSGAGSDDHAASDATSGDDAVSGAASDDHAASDDGASRSDTRSALRTVLIDFGVAQRADAPHSGRGDLVFGSVAYMSPERLTGGPVSPTADIYSFGVILYQLLTGQLPFRGAREAIIHGHRMLQPARPSDLAGMPRAVEELCLSCLDKRPDARPSDAGALREALVAAFRRPSRGRRVRTPARGESALTSDRLSVVLLAVSGAPAPTDAIAVAERHQGFVARRSGELLVCGFTAASSQTPWRQAIAAARELHEGGCARVCLHLADVVQRSRGDVLAIYGDAVERPETWLPPPPWRGVRLTPEIAEVLPPGTSRPVDGGYELAQERHVETDSPFLGREGILRRARASFADSVANSRSRLVTAIGEPGIGKSRLCAEILRAVADGSDDAVIVSVQASQPADGARDETAWALSTELARLIDERPPDRPPSVRELAQVAHRAAASGPLALVVDDCQLASDTVLDAIELASIEGAAVPLWIFVAATPTLYHRRPAWGRRGEREERHELRPLTLPEASQLAQLLLRPVEFPPRELIAQLAGWSAGNPYMLHALIRNLVRSGAVRRGLQEGSWYVTTGEGERLLDVPASEWLAQHELAAMPRGLAELTRVCAVLGAVFSRDELVAVLREGRGADPSTTAFDPDAGLPMLASLGVLEARGSGLWAFCNVLFQQAVYRSIAPASQAHIHAIARDLWRDSWHSGAGTPERALAALARHADALGDVAAAARAYVTLGDLARQRHRYLDADSRYSKALQCDDDATRVDALRGRGAVRYRLHRIHEALDDLARARKLAEAPPRRLSPAAICAIVLEQATALDWAGNYEASARCVHEAGALLSAASQPDPRLAARYTVAVGRGQYRREMAREAVETLSRGYQLAAGADDSEYAIISLLLLGPLLSGLGRLDEAEERFASAIALCREVGDSFHLCVAYMNRAWLWLARSSLSRARADLLTARELSRENGQPILERGAVHTLAELLHWSGDAHAALGHARRACVLQRFLPAPAATDLLLLARILAAAGDHDAAREQLERIRQIGDAHASDVPPSEQLLLRMLELTLAGAERATRDQWRALLDEADALLPSEEQLETLYFAIEAEQRRDDPQVGPLFERARALLSTCEIWQRSFDDLALRCGIAAQ